MNGYSLWSREMVLRLVQLGARVVVVDLRESRAKFGYLSHDADFHSEGISEVKRAVAGYYAIESAFQNGLRFISAAWQLRRILGREKADIVLTLYGGGLATTAWLSGFRPFIVYLVGSDVHSLGRMARVVTRLALAEASVVLANGVHLAATATATLKKAVVPLYLGVNTTKFQPTQKPLLPIKIVCTRGFQAVYNNAFLIYGLARMKRLSNPVEVVFVSRGPLLPAARRLAEEQLGKDPLLRVEFMDGGSESTLVTTVSSSHIFVSLSRADGTSSSLIEALACGLFPVLSDIPANREWIDESVPNGILVPLEDTDALGRALTRAISDEGMRVRAAEYNRNLAVVRADGERSARALLRNIEDVSSRNRIN